MNEFRVFGDFGIIRFRTSNGKPNIFSPPGASRAMQHRQNGANRLVHSSYHSTDVRHMLTKFRVLTHCEILIEYNRMATLLDLCEKYFGHRDFYDVLKISKTATEKQVKKAYHKLSLLVHPDRVEENIKVEATEKFKVLGRIHSILSDNDKRKIYDESGQYDEESDEVVMRNWSDYWRTLFKEITVEDINNYEKTYKGSEIEIKDLKRAYMDSKGDMDYILEAVPFTNCDEEPRLHAIIEKLIEQKDVPEYEAFTKEDSKKRVRRKRKWAREAAEAERLEKMLKIENEENASKNDLALAIQNRNKARAGQADSFFDSLIDKYAKKAEKKPAKKTPGSAKKSKRKA